MVTLQLIDVASPCRFSKYDISGFKSLVAGIFVVTRKPLTALEKGR